LEAATEVLDPKKAVTEVLTILEFVVFNELEVQIAILEAATEVLDPKKEVIEVLIILELVVFNELEVQIVLLDAHTALLDPKNEVIEVLIILLFVVFNELEVQVAILEAATAIFETDTEVLDPNIACGNTVLEAQMAVEYTFDKALAVGALEVDALLTVSNNKLQYPAAQTELQKVALL
jgi:hypothetical protein